VTEQAVQTRWWLAPDDEIAGAVHSNVRFLDEQQSGRRETDLKHLRLYGGTQYEGFRARTYARNLSENRITLNVIKSAVDTATAKIAKNSPRASFLTTGGDWSAQKKAKKLTQLTDGVFYSSGVRRQGPVWFRDACVLGSAFAKVYASDGDIHVERVLPCEVYVDDADAVYGEPRSMFQVRYVDRAVLREMYPRHAEAIDEAKEADAEELGYAGRDLLADQLEVIEAWHLPSGKKAKDGKHVITIENAWLVKEKWEDDWFPFAVLRWSDPMIGFWGTGLAEELTGIQVEINQLLQKIQRSFELLAVPTVYLQQGSKVLKEHLTNQIGRIVTYLGQPPMVVTPQTVHPEVFAHLDRLYQRAFEIAGISMLSASGKKPSGLDSGRALREYSDIESERFSTVAKAYEEFHLGIARLVVAHARKLAASGKFRATGLDGRFLREIEWKDVDLAEDKYVLQAWPVSALPQTPAGRLQTVQELYGAGFLDKETALQLLDFPDLQEASSLALAPLDLIRAQLEKMLDDGEYQPPEPYQDLELARRTAQYAEQRGKIDGAPAANLELVRQYIDACGALLSQAQAASQPAAPPALPMPQAPLAPAGAMAA